MLPCIITSKGKREKKKRKKRLCRYCLKEEKDPSWASSRRKGMKKKKGNDIGVTAYLGSRGKRKEKKKEKVQSPSFETSEKKTD